MIIGDTYEGEYIICDIFDMPDTVFSLILVLMVRFTSVRFSMVHTKSVLTL